MKKIKFILALTIMTFTSSFTLAEFKPFTKKEFLQNNMKVLENRFDQIDANKDSTVDANEYKAWTQKIAKARQQQMLQLKKADLNKDGQLSQDEIKKFKEKNKKLKK